MTDSTPPSRAAFDALLASFDKAVRALSDAGEGDLAAKIAARAWSDVRHESARADRRLTATLHYLVLPSYRGKKGAASQNTPSEYGY